MRRTKYNNKPTVYNGVPYPSIIQAEYAASLDLMLSNGDIDWWLGEVTVRLGVPENKYTVDFVVGSSFSNGRWAIRAIEIKGRETPKFRHDCVLWARYGPWMLVIVKRGKPDRIITGGGQE